MNIEQAASVMESDKDELPPPNEGEINQPEGDLQDTTPTPEGAERGFIGKIMSRLMATDPNPELENVDSAWNPEQGGMTRIFRGIQKMGDIEGIPAIADIVIGIIEIQSSDEINLGQENSTKNEQTEIEQI